MILESIKAMNTERTCVRLLAASADAAFTWLAVPDGAQPAGACGEVQVETAQANIKLGHR
jgi:hypothetical protein